MVLWTGGWFAGDPFRGAPFIVSAPLVQVDGNQIEVQVQFTSHETDTVRGWFLLAAPGDAEPWKTYSFMSGKIERRLDRDVPTLFQWWESVDVRPGDYQVTVWFHKWTGSEWVHLAGGAFGMIPVRIESANNEPIPLESPFGLEPDGAVPQVAPGDTLSFGLRVEGQADADDCRLLWLLTVRDGGRPIAHGEADDCRRPSLVLPQTILPGGYQLILVPIDASMSEVVIDELLRSGLPPNTLRVDVTVVPSAS